MWENSLTSNFQSAVVSAFIKPCTMPGGGRPIRGIARLSYAPSRASGTGLCFGLDSAHIDRTDQIHSDTRGAQKVFTSELASTTRRRNWVHSTGSGAQQHASVPSKMHGPKQDAHKWVPSASAVPQTLGLTESKQGIQWGYSNLLDTRIRDKSNMHMNWLQSNCQ